MIQDPKKFCFGMDAVLLSGFARVKKGEVALDMGTGTGIIPILLSDRTDGEHFTGLEIQHECAEMADRSVRYKMCIRDRSTVESRSLDLSKSKTLWHSQACGVTSRIYLHFPRRSRAFSRFSVNTRNIDVYKRQIFIHMRIPDWG